MDAPQPQAKDFQKVLESIAARLREDDEHQPPVMVRAVLIHSAYFLLAQQFPERFELVVNTLSLQNTAGKEIEKINFPLGRLDGKWAITPHDPVLWSECIEKRKSSWKERVAAGKSHVGVAHTEQLIVPRTKRPFSAALTEDMEAMAREEVGKFAAHWQARALEATPPAQATTRSTRL